MDFVDASPSSASRSREIATQLRHSLACLELRFPFYGETAGLANVGNAPLALTYVPLVIPVPGNAVLQDTFIIPGMPDKSVYDKLGYYELFVLIPAGRAGWLWFSLARVVRSAVWYSPMGCLVLIPALP